MPPAAMRSSVVVSIDSASGVPRTAIRRTNSSVIGWGNFGAPPNPPQVASNDRRSSAIACDVSSSVSGSSDEASDPAREIASTTRPACCSRSVRRSRHASAIPSSTWRNDGMPCDGTFGKYVPAKNGLPSGVRNADSGQPPWPVIAWTASM